MTDGFCNTQEDRTGCDHGKIQRLLRKIPTGARGIIQNNDISLIISILNSYCPGMKFCKQIVIVTDRRSQIISYNTVITFEAGCINLGIAGNLGRYCIKVAISLIHLIPGVPKNRNRFDRL